MWSKALSLGQDDCAHISTVLLQVAQHRVDCVCIQWHAARHERREVGLGLHDLFQRLPVGFVCRAAKEHKAD